MGDVVAVVQAYILKAIEEAGPGMKVMLLDSETTPILSLAFAQSALMRQEVFLFERLQNQPSQEDMRHLKCIAILRPDPVIKNVLKDFPSEMKFQESLKLLAAEIGNPRYGSYHIYLTNLLPKASVKQLAEADMQEVVKEIKEIYIDYLPIGKSILSSFPFPGLPPFHVPKSVAGTHLFGLSLQHPLQPLGSR